MLSPRGFGHGLDSPDDREPGGTHHRAQVTRPCCSTTSVGSAQP
ncbi:hypothetical protein SALBM311S_07227 [Streptomyces alboniger]